MTRILTVLDGALELQVPANWVEVANPGGPVTLAPDGDDANGVLQISTFSAAQAAHIAAQPDLGEFVASVGGRLPGFGAASSHEQGTCVLGRYGHAVFTQGDFRALSLWITVDRQAVIKWNWIGSDPASDAATQAPAVVLTAHLRPGSRPRTDDAPARR